MLKRLCLTWFYKRLPKYTDGEIDRFETLTRYVRFAHMLSLDNACSRTLKHYVVATKTSNIEELSDVIDHVIMLMNVRNEDIDQHQFFFKSRDKRRLHLWLVDKNNYVYPNSEAYHLILHQAAHLVKVLTDVCKSHRSLSGYYINANRSLINELIEVMDGMISVTLGVTDVTRNTRAFIER